MEIQISSLNVRGIGDKQKRSELFSWLRSKKFSLYLLQEVHCSNDIISMWSSEWDYKSLFSCCSSAKGGVAILFNNNFSFQILRLYLDTNGRFIICDIETEGKCITLATLYAPNEDEPSFFQGFFDHLSDFQCDDLIIDRKSVYLLPFKCTKITKLITFQFKLLHRRIATNSFLKKIGVK